MNKLYHILEFKKEGKESSRPKVTGQLYWPTSRGFPIYKNLLTDRTNANWRDIIFQLFLVEDEDEEDENEDENENKVLQEENEDKDEDENENENEDEDENENEVLQEEHEHIFKTIKSLPKEIGEAHWAAAVLLATAHMLERLETVMPTEANTRLF
jgi:superfamily II DNA helicase RecQ